MALVQGSDGNLYGTTYSGGAHNSGTVFSVTTAGVLTTLHNFGGGGTDGAFPVAGLVRGTDGNFYGTTSSGGANNDGTVFKITLTGVLTTLYSFAGGTDGANPYAPLALGPDGNFYGTTLAGGIEFGTVFQITPTGSVTPLHSFAGGSDGSAPYAGLVSATDGNLYGTSSGSGDESPGTIFSVTTTGTFATLYNFCQLSGCADGQIPNAGLVQGADGNFYGTTYNGGTGGNRGTVFQFVLSTRVVNTIHTFTGPDGANPYAGLLLAADGNFYGTTKAGGSANNAGTIFKTNSTGSSFATLYTFCTLTNCPDGQYPDGGLVQAGDGNFYGTTYQGGANNDGTVFKLAASSYTLTVSVSGSGTVTSTDGIVNCTSVCSYVYAANAVVTLNASAATGWNFTNWGGACSGTGPCNITMTQNMSATATFTQQVFQLTVSTSGSGTVASVDGGISCPSTCVNSYPAGTPVTLNATPAAGWSFTSWGGACSGTGSCNVTMSQAQSVTATFTRLPSFFNLTVSISGNGTVTSNDGIINCPGTCSHTYAGGTQVVLTATASAGNTFSAWSGGGCSGTAPCTVNMTQDQAVSASFTGQQDLVAHNFGNGNDGQNPVGGLVADTAGNLYGTTSTNGLYGKGTVFKVAASGGAETVLHNFGSGNDGQTPLGNLVIDHAGNLYGTTSAGGIYNDGIAFEIAPNGTETVLYNFGSGTDDGRNPQSGLVFDTASNLYGTTANGGAFGAGTAFELTPANGRCCREAPVYNFGSGADDGKNPQSGLVFDTAGNLYGTTANGGTNSGGTIYELSPQNGRCCREAPVYNFGGSGDGTNPYGGVIFDAAGNLYGTTVNGGANGGGTAFEVSLSGESWTETFLHSFGAGSDGKNPYAGLVLDSFGNLYGTTASGGLYSDGMVFELSLNENRCCREAPVYNFGFSPNDGQQPKAALIIDSTGKLDGTTVSGGAFGGGTVFGILPISPPAPSQFLALTPCRVVDTRNPNGTFGGPAIAGGTARSFPLSQAGNPCGIPANAVAYSLNVTVVTTGHLGYLTIWPTGQSQPLVSTMNSRDGRTKANATIIPAGTPNGAVSVYVTDTTNVILDIDGYFAAPTGSTLAFYPLTPCRVADTRNPNGDLGGPFLTGSQERDFPILESSCIPNGVSPSAYSLNVTALAHPARQRLGYLTVWPVGQPQPTVSTLNNPTGTNVANAAVVPAGTNGAIAVYPNDDTDLLIDINGYFAAQGPNGLSLYTAAPCRVLDTRNVGNGQPFQGNLTVNAAFSMCAPPNNAQAFVFNATVVPPGSLGYLTLWPDGENQPVVSTLNAPDGSVTSNMAIVPTSNGSIDAYASALTQLLLDISSYFAP